MKKPLPKTNPQAEKIAAEMLDREERVQRAAAAIEEICKRERVTIGVASLAFQPNGTLTPQIQLVPQ
jgi:hypothetical protein